MQTAGTFSQDTAFPDAQIMVDPTNFVASGATPVATLVTFAGNNVPVVAGTTAATMTAVANLSKLVLRTGVFAPSTPQTLSGQAFGTAAALPGPQAAVPLTSSPFGFGVKQVIPPILKANLPTLIGSVPGAKPKGIQINWVDLLYDAGPTTPVTSITVSMFQMQYPTGVGQTPTTVTLLPATTVSTAIQTAGKTNRVRLTPSTIAMITNDGSMILLQVVIVYVAGSGAHILGAILGCSYNFN